MTLEQPAAERPLVIEEWSENHSRWADLMQTIAEQKQTNWATFNADFHRSSHILVATQGEVIAGFLRYVLQEIGPDMGCPSLKLRGKSLIEAKILAFGVKETQRRQGIGRALQAEALRQARQQGCYQVRSHSSGYSQANHQLKLSMGFAVHPFVDGDDDRAVYFVRPLHQEIR